jgi:hypothetical protein
VNHGLSISHDIIVKQHGGSIEVDTQPGEFTEIRVISAAQTQGGGTALMLCFPLAVRFQLDIYRERRVASAPLGKTQIVSRQVLQR